MISKINKKGFLTFLFSLLILLSCERDKEVFITLNHSGQQTFEIEDTIRFAADVQVVGKWDIDTNVEWSSTNSKVGTIDATGIFIALDTGKTDIKATLSNGKYALTEVIVVGQSPKSIKLSKETHFIEMGGRDSLVAQVKPSSILQKYPIKWVVDAPNVIQIDSSKIYNDTSMVYYTALSKGRAKLSLKIGKTTAVANLTVLEKLKIAEREKYLQTNGKEAEFSAKIATQLLEEEDVVNWTSTDESVLKVNLIRQVEGKTIAKVQPLKEGEAKLIASIGNYADTCQIYVGALATLSWNDSKSLLLKSVTMNLNETYELPVYATIQPDEDYYINNMVYEWKNENTDIVSIVKNNQNPKNKKSNICTLQSGAKEGTSNISVTARGMTISAIVTVRDKNKIAVDAITLDKTTAEVEKDAYIVLVAEVMPRGVAATWPVKWTSADPAIASVDDTGKVTGIAAGTTTITAKSKDKTATCQVTVIEVVKSIIIETDTRNILMVGDSEMWIAKINPPSAGAVFKTTWSSTDASVASVDDKGKIVAKKIGKTTITAKAGEQTAQREVEVVSLKPNIELGDSFEQGGYAISGKKLTLKVETGTDVFDFDFVFDKDMSEMQTGKYTVGQDITMATVLWSLATPQVKANITSGSLQIKEGNDDYTRTFVFDMQVKINKKTIIIRGSGLLEEL